MSTFTFQVYHQLWYGWGVAIQPFFGEEGETSLADEESFVAGYDAEIIYIAPGTVSEVGSVPCVRASNGEFIPYANFFWDEDDGHDDTFDLRCKFFTEYDDAEKYLTDLNNNWRHPNPWQKFIRL